MTEWPQQPARTPHLVPAVSIGLAVAAIGSLSVSWRGTSLVPPLAALLLLVGILVPAHRRVLEWRNLVALTAVVVLVIPIRREAIMGELPFALEPYRILIALMVAVWIAALAVDPRVRLRRTFLDLPLFAVLAVTTASVIVNQNRIRQLAVDATVTKATGFLLAFVLFFWLVVSVVRTLRDVDFVVRVLVVTGAIVALFALVEYRAGYSLFDQIVRAIPGSDPALAADPYLSAPVRGGRLRVFGSAQHPIEFSAIMAMLVPLGLYLVQTTRRARWYLPFGLIVLGMLATASRTGVVMTVVVVGVFLWLRPVETRRLWPLVIPGVVVVRLAAPGALRELVGAFFPAGGLLAEQQSGTVGSGRLASLGPGLGEVAIRPLLGGGYGSRIVTGPETNSFIVDNMWLALGMEVGLLGVLAWLWLVVRFLRRTSRIAKHDYSERGWLLVAFSASVLAYAVGMLTFDALSFVQVTFLMVFLLALAASVVHSKDAARVRDPVDA